MTLAQAGLEPAQLAAVLEQLPCGVLVLDAAGRLTLINRVCRQILGPTLDFARPVDEQATSFAAKDATTGGPVPVASMVARVMAGEEIHGYEVMCQPPGSEAEVWLQVSGAPLRDSAGAITGVVVAMTDVSQERRLAQEVATHARQNLYLQGVLAERQRRLDDLLQHLLQPRASAPPESTSLDRLTPRECEVLRLLGTGQSNLEIARALHLSVGTVRLHVKHILAKLGVTRRTQAALRAWQHWQVG
jgi:DNA-binding CsgD family transcriptional regulator/transcriptional regulator with PAS, ATPase and Fis domain